MDLLGSVQPPDVAHSQANGISQRIILTAQETGWDLAYQLSPIPASHPRNACLFPAFHPTSLDFHVDQAWLELLSSAAKEAGSDLCAPMQPTPRKAQTCLWRACNPPKLAQENLHWPRAISALNWI